MSNTKRSRRAIMTKTTQSEDGAKVGRELLSGKKESTTASRSPKSDDEKKEHEEITKSAISSFDLPVKNPSDIRSYFLTGEPVRRVIKSQVFKIKREEKTNH